MLAFDDVRKKLLLDEAGVRWVLCSKRAAATAPLPWLWHMLPASEVNPGLVYFQNFYGPTRGRLLGALCSSPDLDEKKLSEVLTLDRDTGGVELIAMSGQRTNGLSVLLCRLMFAGAGVRAAAELLVRQVAVRCRLSSPVACLELRPEHLRPLWEVLGRRHRQALLAELRRLAELPRHGTSDDGSGDAALSLVAYWGPLVRAKTMKRVWVRDQLGARFTGRTSLKRRPADAEDDEDQEEEPGPARKHLRAS